MTHAVRPSRAGALPTPALFGAAGLVVAVAALELVPRLGLVSADFLPPTSTIAVALVDQVQRPAFWVALRDTMITWGIGLGIAVGAGLLAGVVIGIVPGLRALTASTIEFLRPIPSVALIPLAVLLYGSGIRATLMLVIYASFWQMLVQVLHGVVDVDPVARDTARSYRLGLWARIRYLVWPTALPYVVTGVRLAASVALILTITGELIIGTPGLGREIAVANESNSVPPMYALVVVTGLLGLAANLLFRAAERRILAWHPSQRYEVQAEGVAL
jgi:ABC-type nitrate/sulfonate/bicarbonate transport system permease component